MLDTDTIDDVGILARTIWGEARSEGNVGMTAVACVIMNRAKKPAWWGVGARSVCLKPYQFSCWNKNDPNRIKMLAIDENSLIYLQAKNLAEKVLSGTLKDIVYGATYYYAKFIPTPHWAIGKKPCVEIGTQIFFNNIN